MDLEVAQDRSRTMDQFTKYKIKEGHFVFCFTFMLLFNMYADLNVLD